jgi:hypothetical protein
LQVTTATTIRPRPGTGTGTEGGSRRGGRARTGQAPAPAARRPEPPTPRRLSDSFGSTSLSAGPQSSYRPLDRTPLNLPPSPLLSPSETREQDKPLADLSRPGAGPATSTAILPFAAAGGIDWRLALGDAARVREAIIASEILKPPLALRRRPSR